MPMTSRPATRTCITRGLLTLAALSPFPALAQGTENPFNREIPVELRCSFRKYVGPAERMIPEVANSYVVAALPVRGRWYLGSWKHTNSIFYTWQRPAELREACETALRKANREGAFTGLTVGQKFGNHYEPWYNGTMNHGAPLERIVAFGDSLSDTGNALLQSSTTFGISLPNPLSWYNGRFSNGPVWTEYLSERTGLPLNTWAVGGSETSNAQYGLISGIDSQVESFLSYMRSAENYDASRTLFTLMIGANDITTRANDDTETMVYETLQKVFVTLKKLTAKGARHIVLANLPDISRVPRFAGTNEAANIRAKVKLANEHLPILVRRLAEDTGAQVVLVDVASRFDGLLDSPEAFGMTNVTEPCLNIGKQALAYTARYATRRTCDPATTVFWDQMHPTTRVHELMAGWALDELPVEWELKK